MCQRLTPRSIGQLGGAAGDRQRRGTAVARARPTPRGTRTRRGRARAPSSRPRGPRSAPRATAPGRPSAPRTPARPRVKSRSRMVGVRSSERRNRSISTTSTPMPIMRGSTLGADRGPDERDQVRQRSAASEIGSISRLGDGQLGERGVVECALGLRHPVDEAVVAAVVALQHAAHRRRRRGGRGSARATA